MNSMRWARHPVVVIVTLAIAALYLYGYASKIQSTERSGAAPTSEVWRLP